MEKSLLDLWEMVRRGGGGEGEDKRDDLFVEENEYQCCCRQIPNGKLFQSAS